MLGTSESLSKWHAIEGIDFGFISAEVQFDFPTLYVRLIDGRTNVENHQDLVFRFESVAAFTVYEEFVHPTQGATWGRDPTISEASKSTYPCLIVCGSSWFESLRDELEINCSKPVHYRLCTHYPVIDIVSSEPPSVCWHRRTPATQDAVIPAWAPNSNTL
jgi:hypothetical protein